MTMAASPVTVTAAILAGGLGTRLRSVVADRPKVLAPVLGRPYLAYLLDQLAEASIPEVVLLTGYLADQVRDTFGERHGSMRLLYSPEPRPLGTAGAARLALPLFTRPRVLLLNGDSYCRVNVPAFLAFHQRHDAQISLVASKVLDTSRFGTVDISSKERVVGFAEKQAGRGEGWINAGIYLLERSLIEEIPPDRPVSLERELFPFWIGRKAFYGFRGPTHFLDIGTPESYREAEIFFAPEQLPV
jgi:NDP-sugar pyrophosphorylase family protein